MFIKKIAIVSACFLSAFSFAIAADGAGTDAKKLFEAKCGLCHPAEKPLSLTKDVAGWTATVKRMQAKNPGNISDAEADAIIKYLAAVRGGK